MEKMVRIILIKPLQFDPAHESITTYVEQAELFFRAKKMQDEEKVRMFLTVMGEKSLSLVRNHFSPDSPSEKSFGEIVNVLKSSFKLNPQLIVKRFCFSGRQQAADETVAEFAAELRTLSEHCEFKTYLDDALIEVVLWLA